MRLFLALLPDEETRRKLINVQNEMKELGIIGRFTDPFNMHVTLAFIGEYGDPEKIMDVIEEIDSEPLVLKIRGVRKMKDLYVLAADDNDPLNAYVKRLRRALAENGIPFDRKSFFAHITMVRKAAGPAVLPCESGEIEMNVSGVSLMKSESGKHGMVYTEIGRIGWSLEEIS